MFAKINYAYILSAKLWINKQCCKCVVLQSLSITWINASFFSSLWTCSCNCLLEYCSVSLVFLHYARDVATNENVIERVLLPAFDPWCSWCSKFSFIAICNFIDNSCLHATQTSLQAPWFCHCAAAKVRLQFRHRKSTRELLVGKKGHFAVCNGSSR